MDGMGKGRYAALTAAVMMLAGLAGCGGGGSSSAPDPGSAPASQSPSVSGQGGALTLTALVSSPTKVDMSWAGVAGAQQHYRVYRNGSPDASITVGSAGAFDTGLKPGTQYCYQVTSEDSAGGTTASSNRSCVTTAALAGWNVAMLTPAPPVTLALDAQGYEHLGYCTSAGVAYAVHGADGSWSEQLAAAGAQCTSAVLALDGSGIAHILYLDTQSDELMYLSGGAGSWNSAPVTGAEGAEFYRLALDTAGHAHVAYLAFTGVAPHCYEIMYANDASGTWQTEPVAAALGYPAVAVDGNGQAYIAYVDSVGTGGGYPLHYLTRASGAWTDAVAAVSADPKSLVALAVDPAGHASLVYKSGATLYYAGDGSGAWQLSQVDGFDAAGPEYDDYGAYDVSMALDADGLPHTSYEDTSGNLKYAAETGGGWNTSYVDTEGTQNHVRIDMAGHAHIVYGNAQNLYSKLAVSP